MIYQSTHFLLYHIYHTNLQCLHSSQTNLLLLHMTVQTRTLIKAHTVSQVSRAGVLRLVWGTWLQRWAGIVQLVAPAPLPPTSNLPPTTHFLRFYPFPTLTLTISENKIIIDHHLISSSYPAIFWAQICSLYRVSFIRMVFFIRLILANNNK